jgi:hypothetical protein
MAEPAVGAKAPAVAAMAGTPAAKPTLIRVNLIGGSP